MPRYNSLGDLTGGVGTLPLWVWVKSAPAPQPLFLGAKQALGGGSRWRDDLTIVNQVTNDGAPHLVEWMGSPTGSLWSAVTIDEQGANALGAGNNNLLAALQFNNKPWELRGTIDNQEFKRSAFTVVDMDRSGNFCIGRQDGVLQVYDAQGQLRYELPPLYVFPRLNDGMLMVREGRSGALVVFDFAGKPIPISVNGAQQWPALPFLARGIIFLAYFCTERGTILHPANNRHEGYIIGKPNEPRYGFDIYFEGDLAQWAFATGEGEDAHVVQRSSFFEWGDMTEVLEPVVTPPPPPGDTPVRPTTQQIIDAVVRAKQQTEAEGYVFTRVEEWDEPAKARGIRVVVRAVWALAQQFPQANIGLERHEADSGALLHGIRYSPDIILVGRGAQDNGISYDVLVAGADPAAQLGGPAAPGDWQAPLNPNVLPAPPGQPATGIPQSELNRMFGMLQMARGAFGATMTNDQCVTMLDGIAFVLGGWGILSKPAGNNGRRRDGALCSVDFLVYRPTLTGIDVLADAGGASTPVLGAQEVFGLDRFVAPIGPIDDNGPIDPPPPPSGDVEVLVRQLLAKQDQLDERINELFQQHQDALVSLGRVLTEFRDHLDQKLDRQYTGTLRILGQNVNFTLTPKN